MKKIINGKLYNTQTAKALASRDNHCQPGSFDYVEEILYRKKTGEFFMRGSGGARTIYSEHFEGGSRGSSRIVPLTDAKARKWVETYADADKYTEIFGDVEE